MPGVDNRPRGNETNSGSGSLNDNTGFANKADWLKYALEANQASTTFMDTSLIKRWERNTDLFRSKHPKGSKYHSEQYKKRSKIFRPKTRSMIRRHEAAAAVAYFSTKDATNITAENEFDPRAVVTAGIHQDLLNYRLEHDIPWFNILIGAYQEAMVIGTVVSCQEWVYKTRTVKRRLAVIDESTGQPMMQEDGAPQTMEYSKKEIVKDYPNVRLVPLENIRIDPSSDWADPINSSPYVIELMPMYVMDVKLRMKEGAKNEDPWHQLDDNTIMSAINNDYDSLRRAREGRERTDSKDRDNYLREYDIVWVHRNIIAYEGEDYVYYTLGTQELLSDPKPLAEHFYHGVRPYTYGNSVLEAHRIFPSGLPEIGEGLQVESNDIANQRLDNVKLVLNRRYFAKRGSRIDFRSLMRNTPGSVTLMDDINTDLKSESLQDVTSSAYQEQDRLSLDFDEVTGGFSSGSVQSNRNLNETVGGMEMLKGDSNQVGEYQIRTFNETWVEKTLKQIVLLEQAYETDEDLLSIISDKSKLQKKYGIKKITDIMLQGRINVRVNVGFGATNPEKRIQKLALGLGTVERFAPHMAQRIKTEEVVNEIFGAVGLDGTRFYEGIGDEDYDKQFEQMRQQLQKLQQALESKQMEQETRKLIQQMADQTRLKIAQMQETTKANVSQMNLKLEYIDRQLVSEQNEIKRGQLHLQKQSLIEQIKIERLRLLQDERNHLEGAKADQTVGNDKAKITGESSMRGNGKDSQVAANGQYENIPGAEG